MNYARDQDYEDEFKRIESVNGLLHGTISITSQDQTKKIDRLALDTGAFHTIISSDAVDDLGVSCKSGDAIVQVYGVSGMEYSFQKLMGCIEIAEFLTNSMFLDFGRLEWDIYGLIGLDILESSHFVIDLDRYELYQK